MCFEKIEKKDLKKKKKRKNNRAFFFFTSFSFLYIFHYKIKEKYWSMGAPTTPTATFPPHLSFTLSFNKLPLCQNCSVFFFFFVQHNHNIRASSVSSTYRCCPQDNQGSSFLLLYFNSSNLERYQNLNLYSLKLPFKIAKVFFFDSTSYSLLA